MEQHQCKSKTKIQQFYQDQNILVTGATGYLGKLLVEKLLRTCTGLKKLYIIVRTRKGKSPEQRIQDIFQESIFAKLREEVPNFLEKVFVIPGDCVLPNSGLSEEHRQLMISEINIVFHNAATVKFDEKIKLAAAINILGTKYLLSLAKEFKNLKAFVHISTAYSNCINKTIQEKIYEPPVDPDEFLNYLQNADDKELDLQTPTIIGDFPNTYTYTKNLAETVVKAYADTIPIVIFRPSIVIGTWKQPSPGWIDNAGGPVGVAIGVGVGLVRIILLDVDKTSDVVPADYVVNAMITAAWDKVHNARNSEAKIINFVSGKLNKLTWDEFRIMCLHYALIFPAKSIWYYTASCTANIYVFYVLFFLYQFLPALIVDAFLLITKGKTRLTKIYKKVFKLSMEMSYFSLNEWNFEDENIRQLWNTLDERDRKLFPFNLENIRWDELLLRLVKSVRILILKEPMSTVYEGRKKMERLKIFHYSLMYGLVALFTYFLCTVIF